jgi:hypothetical protein
MTNLKGPRQQEALLHRLYRPSIFFLNIQRCDLGVGMEEGKWKGYLHLADPESHALNNNIPTPTTAHLHPQRPTPHQPQTQSLSFCATLPFKSSPSNSSLSTKASNGVIHVWGGLERSLSPLRVIRRSAGSTSSFIEHSEGSRLSELRINGRPRGSSLASSSSLLSPTLSSEVPEFPIGIDRYPPASAAAAASTVLDNQLLIVLFSSPEPTMDN